MYRGRPLLNSLSGKDVLVQSQTGTGKTAAFLVTVYHILLTREDYKNRKVLILAPTRELVIQIEKEAKLLVHFLI
jgi:ATP-dependent RNA helicase RhlB